MRYLKSFTLLSLAFWGCQPVSQPITKTMLNQNWEFKQADSTQWRSATVPGVVQSDLMDHNIIPDPWKGLNEKKVQWVENKDWQYKTTFDVAKEALSRQHIDLVFDGLDTYAKVTLNDSAILYANNMFRSWRTDVKPLLKVGENKLAITFLSPITVNMPKLKALGYELPANNETVENKVSPFTRKAPYHFGWDWGLRLVTAGIWRPVYLESWDAARINDVYIEQKSLTEESASLTAHVEIIAGKTSELTLDVNGNKEDVKLQKGTNNIAVDFSIDNPKRWWPNGWGEAFLYDIPTSLLTGDQVIDLKNTKIGLRTIELVQEEDSNGRSFYFMVNGEHLFAKGADYIPQSHFLAKVTPEAYEMLIGEAKKTNMNMLRVWGGGIYENDIFYDLCDKNGILVWQDFMFACGMYPGDSAFVGNVKKEVTENVKRLRNHPSIALWNGNNEIDVAWHNWGWQKKYGYSKKDSAKIWHDYLAMFQEAIPNIVHKLDDRPYTSTSPLSNWGKPENYNYGSMHYWGVWHGPDDFEGYRKHVGRFMSEYGYQSFPNMETIAYFADSSDWSLDSEVMKHHQKSYVGNDLIMKHTKKYFGKPKNFEDFVYKSQQTQALAMEMAIDAHRLKKGHCWGTLYWQLNDCWPGPSWSSIDVFGRKKLFHKELSTLFAPVALIPLKENGELTITLVNDLLKPIRGTMELALYDGDAELWISEKGISCMKNGKKKVYHSPVNKILDGIHPKNARLEMKLTQNNEVVFERSFDLR